MQEVQDGAVGDVTGVNGARHHREPFDAQEAAAAQAEVQDAGDQQHQGGRHSGDCGS